MTEKVESNRANPADLGVRLGRFGNCVLLVWSGAVRPAEIEAMHAYTDNVVEACAGGVTILTVIQDGTPLPSAEGKRSLEAYFGHYADRIRAAAHVAEGTGLWASMARSVITALQLVRRRPYPTKVFSDVAEGIEWLAPHVKTDGPSTPADNRAGLTNCVAALRRRG